MTSDLDKAGLVWICGTLNLRTPAGRVVVKPDLKMAAGLREENLLSIFFLDKEKNKI